MPQFPLYHCLNLLYQLWLQETALSETVIADCCCIHTDSLVELYMSIAGSSCSELDPIYNIQQRKSNHTITYESPGCIKCMQQCSRSTKTNLNYCRFSQQMFTRSLNVQFCQTRTLITDLWLEVQGYLLTLTTCQRLRVIKAAL